MTIEELKVEAAKLPADERFTLAEWIGQNDDIRDLRRDLIVREINVGLRELDQGQSVECRDDAELNLFFDGLKMRGRELQHERSRSVA